jgi:hypothetical protein
MPQPGSHKYDIKRARLRKAIDASGIPDEKADKLANEILKRGRQARRLLSQRVLRNAGRFLPRGR